MLMCVVLLLLTCQLTVIQAVADVQCKPNDKCPEGECCFINYNIATRRDLQRGARKMAYPYQQGGICQPFKTKGEYCDIFSPCGCEEGLTCTSIPLASNSVEARLIAGGGQGVCT